MTDEDPVTTAERLTLEMARLGSDVTKAMTAATGLPDVVSNTPLLVLCMLDIDGPARPNVIAGVVGLTSGGTTKLLDRLEDAGLIERAYGVLDDDHRGVLVTLTALGRKKVRAAAGALVDHLPDAASLVKEIVSLIETLQADR